MLFMDQKEEMFASKLQTIRWRRNTKPAKNLTSQLIRSIN